MPDVNPKILKWARETAGLSLEAAARAVDIKAARGKTGAERLAAIEAGENEPSRPVLLRMAKKYKRSLVIFYLQEPPKKGDRGEDFRRSPGSPAFPDDPTLDTLIRDIRSRQMLVRSLLEDQDFKPLDFVASARMEDGRSELISKLTNALSFQLNEFRKQPSVKDAFDYLRTAIEKTGIFVLLVGNLGSHHTNISSKAFRGYAIADPLAPMIVINDQDAHEAWSFTAIHEVAHLWLGSTGISGSPTIDSQIERFCNDVAGEILLPQSDLKELSSANHHQHDELVEEISHFADVWKISRSMVAYKLFQSGIIGKREWQNLDSQFYKEWQDSRIRSRERTAESSDGGPSYYVVRRHRLGEALLKLITHALGEGTITYTKAGRVLGVKPRNVAPLLGDLSYQGEVK